MTCYVGLDVSMKETAICVVDGAGDRIWAGTSRTDPDAIMRRVALARKLAVILHRMWIEERPFEPRVSAVA
jgi:transposase